MSGVRAGSREIRDELDRTRASLDRAFDALGSKLTPASLFWDGVGVFRSGAGAGVSRAMHMAQQHPLPACVIGMGVGWLLLENARTRRGEATFSGPAGEVDELDGSAGEVASRAGERVRESAEAVKEKATRAAQTVKEQASRTAQTVRQQASQAAGAVREQASHTADAVREKAGFVKGQARDQARRAGSEFDRLLQEQPMTVGLGALALGMLVGLLIPATRREDEALGEVRDRKVDRARDAARETLEKGKQVARSAVETAKETVKTESERQHLRPRDIVEDLAGGPQGQPPEPVAR